MKAPTDHVGDRISSFDDIAAAVLDAQGTVLRWSRGAAELLDRTAAEVCGHPVGDLVGESRECRGETPANGMPAAGRVLLRHRSGTAVEVAFHVSPLEAGSEYLVLAAPTRCVADWEQGASLLRALLSQQRVGVSIHDLDLRFVRTNDVTFGMSGDSAPPVGGRLADVMSAEEAEATEAELRRVLDTGKPVVRHQQRVRTQHAPGRQWTFSLTAVRLEDAQGHPTGVAALGTDATGRQRSRRHLELRHEASVRIGRSLDVQRTTQDLADVLVPALGDLAWVNLAHAVLDGDEPPKIHGGGELHLRRTAVASATGPWPAELLQPGAPIPPSRDWPGLRALQQGETFILRDRASAIAWFEHAFPGAFKLHVPEHGHSMVLAPLFARGLLLGTVTVWRTERPEPFDQQDANLLAEITSRASLSVDNARRYTRERRAAVALQQRLLPRGTTDTPAAETAALYLPASGGADISGDWFDVIPLPSLRTAFVVGDVIGHGLPATATMGRLRTAVQTLADLELGPEELLTHLDDLVARLAAEAEHADTIGATCLYAVYDPIARRCTYASAGHPPPLVCRPDGTARRGSLSPGPPLGVGGMPFEATTVDMEPGSTLALYTDGVLGHHERDIDAGIQQLAGRLTTLLRAGHPLEAVGRTLLADASAAPPSDDMALLLARVRALPTAATASWEFPADRAVVARARDATIHQLAAWGLDEAAFTTELIVSELITNAIRYAGGPIGLRLIHDATLVCEVTDPSNTQPRLRRARTTDESGRGLFLVAQLATRWGSRYGESGKTIWAEQPLPATAAAAATSHT
ncbi:ATP-binding SpoIIE family protein phosphatase [Streptomyces winkii]|uniref:ATP-binding SpoIIE family protein phosphatase n=1 Tax=Streptomyces winkii TaxID=3051178 RepID=UPI0028D0FD11|nr:SpoIIE family protein phosphatase [Streptomyces sp. DSM 40971]